MYNKDDLFPNMSCFCLKSHLVFYWCLYNNNNTNNNTNNNNNDNNNCYNQSLSLSSSLYQMACDSKHLLTGPKENSEFCFPRISMKH